MESSKGSSSVPANSGNAISPSSNSGGTSSWSVDNNDVYEFKSSKEATPVRGSSTSPNPEKEKDAKTTGNQGSSGTGTVGSTGSGSSATSTGGGEASATIGGIDEASMTTSPSSKRPFEGDTTDEQDDENRKKKRKDAENNKDNAKGNTSGRQGPGRSGANASEKV